MRKSSPQAWLLIVVLVGILAVAAWWAVGTWIAADADEGAGRITWQGFVALGAGVLGTLVVGVGLMALVFYSSRHYDDDQGRSDGISPPSGREPPDRAP